MSQDTIVLIKDWLLPPGILIILLVLGLLLWRRAIGPTLVLVALLVLYFAAIPQTSAWLAAPLETDAGTDVQTIKDSGAGVILVLLAGRTHHAPELGGKDGLSALSLQRLHYGVRLHRQTGLPLMVSGGAAPEPGDEGLATLAARELTDVYAITPWLVEPDSKNTRDNARNSARLLAPHQIDKVVLVTHAWHMPRSRYSVETAGLSVVPAGTGFETSSVTQASQLSDWLPSAKALWLNRNLLHEHLGLLWYRYAPVSGAP